MNIGVTGHRPQHLGGFDDTCNACYRVKNSARSLILKMQEKNITPVFHIGMALGVDQWVAEQSIVDDIKFIAYIPGSKDEQSSRWHAGSKQRYHRILEHATEEIIVTSDDGNFFKALHDRNLSMIAASDMLYAVYKGPTKTDQNGNPSGGTHQTVTNAIKQNTPTLIYNPENESYTWKHRNRLDIKE